VITAVASSTDWGGAVAGKANAYLKLATQSDIEDSHGLFRDTTVTATEKQSIAFYARHTEQPCYFYQAKKLVLSDKKKEQLRAELFESGGVKAAKNPANWQNIDLLNRIAANEINTTNCLDIFAWVAVSLDEVERLCRNQP
jgi:ribonuclease HIII